MKKRILSMLLALAVVLGMLPVTAYAEKFTDPAIDFIDVTDPDNLGRAVTDGNGHYVDTFAYAAKQEGYIWLEKITLDSAIAWSTDGSTVPVDTVDKVEGTRYVNEKWLSYENDGHTLGKYDGEYVWVILRSVKLYDIKNQCYVEPTTSSMFTLDPDNDALNGGEVVPVGMYAQEYYYDVWTDLYLKNFEPMWVGFPSGSENMTVTMDGQPLKPRSEAWTESLGSHTPGMYWVVGGGTASSSSTTYPCIARTLYVNSPVHYVYDVKPEIKSVLVNGTSVADGGTFTANSGSVAIKTTYDSVLSQALQDYGCSVKQLSAYYLNGEKINVAALTPVSNGNGTSTKTYNRTLNSGDELTVESWLEVTWPDGSKDVVDERTTNVTYDGVKNVSVSATFSGTPANATSNTSGIKVTNTKWYKWVVSDVAGETGYVEMSASDTFEDGTLYKCEVTVAEDGDKLADGYTVKISGEEAEKAFGTNHTWYIEYRKQGVIPLIDVMDIYLPEAGITPDFTCTWDDYDYDDEIYEVEKIEWFKSNASGAILSDPLPADYIFRDDSYYLLKVTVKPKEGWVLYQTGFYINGTKVENDGERGVIGKIVYHTNDAYSKYTVKIDDVTMKDGDYLAWGATAVTATQPSDRYAYYKDGVLTLNNWNDGKKYPTENGVIEFNQRHLKINLVGENYIETIKDKHDVYGYDEDGPYWLTIEGNGSLYLEGYATNRTIAVDGTVSFNGGYIEIDASLWGVSKVERIEINGADVYFTTSQDSFSYDDSVNMVVYGGTFRAFDAGSYAGDEWLNINFLDESAYRVYAGSSTGISNPREVQPDQLEVWTGTDFTSFNSYDLVMASVVPTWRVVYLDDDNTVLDMVQVTEGDTVPQPEDPVKDGYTFLGWYTDDGELFDFNTLITENTYLTAKFEDATSNVLKGDVTGEGKINMADVVAIRKYMISPTLYPLAIEDAGDVTGEGKINMADVVAIRKYMISPTLYPFPVN